ncbi:hypothetical protein MTR62_06040 [Novosphingobium sp. 1949]|uniref:Lipoprotein n=1 Tax=Novosphingobium organovorum TaxID=2930092 RepID=A0ABT0BB25_9SPHN|nr:hypothetical protein [Novosphingobium organovorum]MCJ2182261.1 hypothetical protein [Novosphingobium organovorum]
MTTNSRAHPYSSAETLRPARALGVAALAAALLSGCVAAPGGPTRPSRGEPAPTTVRHPTPSGARDPQFQTIRGLDGVIGVTQRELERQFGQPHLDVWEGDARKLQFIGKACLLDIYLYPTSSSKTPVATYVDARRSSDGQDVDRAACVAALRQR